MVKTCYVVRSTEVFFNASFHLEHQGRGEEGSVRWILGDGILILVLLPTCYEFKSLSWLICKIGIGSLISKNLVIFGSPNQWIPDF